MVHIRTEGDQEVVDVQAQKCTVCGNGSVVTMPAQAYLAWKGGQHLQRAWPQGSADEREQLISGTHPKCWNDLYPPEEDEEQ